MTFSSARTPFWGGLRKSRRGFTVVELLVTVAVVGVLTALLLSALPAVRSKTQILRCLAQLRNVGNAIPAFMVDNNGCLPTNAYGNRWPAQVAPYMGFPTFLTGSAEERKKFYDKVRCSALQITLPDNSNSQLGIYGYHTDLGYSYRSATTLPNPVPLARIVSPSQKPMFGCSSEDSGLLLEKEGPAPGATQYGFGGATTGNGLSPNHGRLCNILFFDGHIESVDVTRSGAWPWNTPNSLELFK